MHSLSNKHARICADSVSAFRNVQGVDADARQTATRDWESCSDKGLESG